MHKIEAKKLKKQRIKGGIIPYLHIIKTGIKLNK